MTKRARKPAAALEWVGGIASLPTMIAHEGEPYLPDVLLWISPSQRLVLGSAIARPDELPGLVAGNLRDTIADPEAGAARPPTRLRVASRALADRLRPDFPDIEIIVAPTPELDSAVAELAEYVAEGPPDPGWLGEGLPADAVGDFFDAMAGLWRAAPWQSVPGDDALFSITVEALDVHDRVAVVIGQMGESFGVLLFDSPDDRDRFASLGEALRHGDPSAVNGIDGGPGMPAHLGLSFDPVKDVTPVRLEERETHAWMLADEAAYPSLTCFEANLQMRAPTAKDLTLGEAIARAFVVVADDEAFEAAWHDGKPVERTLPVPTRDGAQIEVRLRAPADEPEGTAAHDPDAVPERVYRLKIDLERCNWKTPEDEVSRTIELAGHHTLWDLHGAIQQAFDWDDDHLFTFFVSGKLRDRKSSYTGTPIGDVDPMGWYDGGDRSVTETTLDDLELKSRRVMRYVFDQHIVHSIRVSTIREGGPDDTGLPRQVKAVGEVPSQYEFSENDER